MKKNKKKNKPYFNDEEQKNICDLYVNKMKPATEICKLYSCNLKRIYRVLNEHNIERRKGSPMSVNYWIQFGLTVEEAKLKIKSIRPTNIEYYLNKGFTKEEALIELNKMRIGSLDCAIKRYGEEKGLAKWNEKKETSRKIAHKNFNNTIEYQKNNGILDNETIKKNISLNQNKFSKIKCIEKYGEIEGNKIFNERQIKWQKKLQSNPNISKINKKKDVKSIKYFKNKFGDDWLMVLKEKRGYSPESIVFIDECINNCKTYDELIKYISKKYEYINYFYFINHLCKNFLCEYYGVTKLTLKNDLKKEFQYFPNGIFGHKEKYNNILYSSSGEVEIAKYLAENNISFLYNKRYCESKFRYDFYLPEFDIYIEYTGMLCNGNKNKYTQEYILRLNKKIDLCAKYGFNLYISSNYVDIIKKIKDLKNEKEN